MELLYDIKDFFRIKDQHIKITKVDNETHTTILYAILDYPAGNCAHCGGQMIKYDFQKVSKVPYLENAGYPTVILLKKRRFQCKSCKKVQVAETSLVKKNHQISTPVYQKITQKLLENKTVTDVSKELLVSPNTVQRQLDLMEIKEDYTRLPTCMSWDEFSFVNSSMCFIVQDFYTQKLITILDGRTQATILKYFMKYSQKVRSKVKFITMDMYTPYFDIVKKLFPKAKIVIDRFHVVQHMSRALNKTRISLMKGLDRKSLAYRSMKKFWRLLLKDFEKTSEERYYDWTFRLHLTNRERIEKILEFSEELRTHYELYQTLLHHLKNKNKDLFKETVEEELESCNDYFKTVFTTFKKLGDKIDNAIQYAYHNGKLEAANGKIKRIKRNACGFRNFDSLKKRVLLHLNQEKVAGRGPLSRLEIAA